MTGAARRANISTNAQLAPMLKRLSSTFLITLGPSNACSLARGGAIDGGEYAGLFVVRHRRVGRYWFDRPGVGTCPT
jgi:hypothetical protein